jgi:hypothetical protein
MDVAFSMNGETRKPEGKGSVTRWDYNTKTDLKEIRCEDVDFVIS